MVHFTHLRLSGFKSFVDPTEVPIEPGMTGIVGPNGCGKSNLVEALRWVMGENSPKRMRGGEMDDVIFAGSATRPSRNLAEVQIRLDNAERRAVAQFNDVTELEISRRIERGKGSNYSVNGRDVRARDVQLLFADAATGAHSTALVSQGRVGAIINAKPTERRTLLEEAAGITGLHSRRHEAELRLRAAETNLERLDDVISTLEQQLAGLKRQARQATRYRNIAGQIRRTEALLLFLEHEEAQTALVQARERLSAAEARVAELTERTAQRSTEQAEAAAALPELRQTEAEAAAELQRLTIARETLAREEAQVQAARQQAEARLSQVENDRRHAEGQAEDANQAIARLEVEEKELGQAGEGEAEARASAEREKEAAAAEVAEREAELTALSEKVAADEAEAASLARRIDELERRLERLRQEGEEVKAAKSEIGRENADEAALLQARETLEQAEAALARAREEASEAEAALTAARESEGETREALQVAEAEFGRIDAEVRTLARLLEKADADMWPPVVDVVVASPGYEIALGAALGDDLDASTDEAAPVHWESLPPLTSAASLPEGTRALAAVVKAPAALARRLSQVGVVDDVAAARRLQKDLRPGQRLVTRDGALFRWDGFTVAAGAPTAAAQRLEQRNRLSDLREDLKRAEGEKARRAGAHADMRAAVEAAASTERAARDALSAAYNQVNEARAAETRVAQDAAARQSKLSALIERAERIAADLKEHEESLRQARTARENLPDLAAARAQLTELRADLAEKRTALAERQSAVDSLAREADSRGRRLQAIGQEKQSWRDRLENARRHLEALDDRRQAAEAEIAELAEKPGSFAEQREDLAERIAASEMRRKAAADTLAEGETRLAQADRALKEAEGELVRAREERVRAEGARDGAEEALTRLKERVRERLECRLDDLGEVAELDPSQDLPAKTEIESKLQRLTRERDNIGPVNLRAEHEAQELEEQIQGMQNERDDLTGAIARLRQGIASLNREGRERLLNAFEVVDQHFSELFVRLFGGGRAHLKLTEAEDPLEAGLEIMASPPGKRLQVMSLLSGGEQALTALALLFAVFLTNPAPICVLDEVDAPLDDANVDRFCNLVSELSQSTSTRFLVITHHRLTMARMDRLFGVTMSERGISQLVSVDLQAAESLRESA